MAVEMVVLVDSDDVEIGVATKAHVHSVGERHRALSVFLFDREGRLLLQRRADGKYHSPGLWSNTCCGHPRPGEPAIDAARRRLREEMGIECELSPAGTFEYQAEVGEGLLEHELDHVFTGTFDGEPKPDPEEVGEWAWREMHDLASDCRVNPDRYSVWLPLALAHLDQHRRA